ncbi:MAG: hypothetical protein GQ474_00680, partial [Sulfurimonas sp.]|nr:hypothetical protein [Sulfurimonas sp.]
MTKNLIIAGTTKGGTTSLFNYLADNKEICSVKNYKEIRFFLHDKYPVKSLLKFSNHEAETYKNLFLCKQTCKYTLDATPDYMYSQDNAKMIYETLGKDAKLIFILRNPFERLVSWYRYAKQNAEIDNSMTFEEYIKVQLDNNTESKQNLLTYEQSFYSNYLKGYYNVFDKEQILIIFTEELKSNPHKVLMEVTNYLNIDNDVYQDYEFKIFNKTEKMHYPLIHKYY